MYKGTWANDLPEGEGVLYFPNGDIHEGLWHEGKRHGAGKHTFANGDVLTGTWKDHRLHGPMQYTFTNGDVVIGEACYRIPIHQATVSIKASGATREFDWPKKSGTWQAVAQAARDYALMQIGMSAHAIMLVCVTVGLTCLMCFAHAVCRCVSLLGSVDDACV